MEFLKWRKTKLAALLESFTCSKGLVRKYILIMKNGFMFFSNFKRGHFLFS